MRWATGEGASFDILFETAGRITETGYQVEMAIPFSNLRFPDPPEQTWRVHFVRTMPRASRHQIAWTPLTMDNPCLLCQSGTLTCIRGVRPGGNVELLPGVTAFQSGARANPDDPASPFENESVDGAASLGVRYAFSGGWTVEGTYNPDVSQVESDAAQIDVNTTFALFYPERRPFFQEGSDLFDTPLSAVYTRSINDPRGGEGDGSGGEAQRRLHRRPGREHPLRAALRGAQRGPPGWGEHVQHPPAAAQPVPGFVRGRDRHGPADGRRRLRHHPGGGRPAPVLEELPVGLSGRTVEPEGAELTADLEGLEFGYGDEAYTAGVDGESYWGHAAHLFLTRSSRHWDFDVSYEEATPDYRADNGFQTRNNFRRVSTEFGASIFPATPLVDVVPPEVEVGRSWNFDGVQKKQWIRPGIWMQLTGQTGVSASASFRNERFRGVDVHGLRQLSLDVQSRFSEPVNVGFSLSGGDVIARNLDTPALGRGTLLSGWIQFKPTHRLVVSPRISFARLEDPETGELYYSGYIVRARASYQFSREHRVRLVTEYNDFSGTFDVEPLVSYKVNPYSIFYLGSTHGYRDYGDAAGVTATDRQFFLKLQYLLRR